MKSRGRTLNGGEEGLSSCRPDQDGLRGHRIVRPLIARPAPSMIEDRLPMMAQDHKHIHTPSPSTMPGDFSQSIEHPMRENQLILIRQRTSNIQIFTPVERAWRGPWLDMIFNTVSSGDRSLNLNRPISVMLTHLSEEFGFLPDHDQGRVTGIFGSDN